MPTIKIILSTDQPPVYVVRDLEDQMMCARKAGFVFERPILRMMRKSSDPSRPQGFAYMHLNIIALDPNASYAIMAHELGHIIDFQMGRKDHPFFMGKENWDIQVIANSIRDVILKECLPLK